LFNVSCVLLLERCLLLQVLVGDRIIKRNLFSSIVGRGKSYHLGIQFGDCGSQFLLTKGKRI
jgi:hypothetical protein